MPELYDYRTLRPGTVASPRYRHVLMLLYWPAYGLVFLTLERLVSMDGYTAVHCALDDLIPFNEWFLVPYLFWFAYMTVALAYTFFFDVPSFKRMMAFVMVTYSVTVVVYLLWPTCQQLRPDAFPRDNLLTHFLGWFYTFDTNTNVCPSIHVLGAIAVSAAAWDSPRTRSGPWRAAFTAMTALICLSTVFIKQHSVLDVLAALPLSAVGWAVAWRLFPARETEKL